MKEIHLRGQFFCITWWKPRLTEEKLIGYPNSAPKETKYAMERKRVFQIMQEQL